MRIASRTMNDLVKFNLANITEALSQANLVVATEKRINSLSDDPVGLTQALNIKSSLDGIEQLGRNINIGKSWLTGVESALTQGQNILSETKALCVQMASATTGADERASASVTVQNTLIEMVSLSNTEVAGRYVFAGCKTDTAPFTLESDNSVTYSGNNQAFSIKVSRDSTLEVGKDGEDVFGNSGQSNDIFKTLADLKTALESNDIAGIQTQMGKLDEHFNHVTTRISDVGSKMIRIEVRENILQEVQINNKDRLSKLENADIAAAIMDLKAKEVTYQAALAASARVLNVSLVDYLK